MPITGISRAEIRPTVQNVLQRTKIIDIHTHLFPPSFRDLNLWGFDAQMTYHYLTNEDFRATHADPTDFFKLPPHVQADRVWQALFDERSPLSEAAMGVVTCCQILGLPQRQSPEFYRNHFRYITPENYVDTVFKSANLEYVVMTNDPFDPTEVSYWQANTPVDPRFKAALRVDPLFEQWARAVQVMRDAGYSVGGVNQGDFSGIKTFLVHWIHKINPLYLAASFSPQFKYPDESLKGQLMKQVILPLAQERNLPLALMLGVDRGAKPEKRSGGDTQGRADLKSVERLCQENPKNKFLLTVLSEENQHEATSLASVFDNLMIFGLWWRCNNPSIVEAVTRRRLEMLGLNFISQHSDARVLDQLLYKWAHAREIVGQVLAERYEQLSDRGWPVIKEDIQRDMNLLFRDNFGDFLAWQPK